jgi:hypothetical protein
VPSCPLATKTMSRTRSTPRPSIRSTSASRRLSTSRSMGKVSPISCNGAVIPALLQLAWRPAPCGAPHNAA